MKFEVVKQLSAKCPVCKTGLVLKYRHQPESDDNREHSFIIACDGHRDKDIVTNNHWWFDGPRDRETLRKIISSMDKDEIFEMITVMLLKINRPAITPNL